MVYLEALHNFITVLQYIIKVQDLSTGPQKYEITCNLLLGESLRVFEQKTWECGTEINNNYKLVIQYLISHFLPSKELQGQERYLFRGLYKPRETKIREFI